MYIQEIIIDGFKSYATRTVINGWDPSFNAITGLNGSGKSNILDAICFVLGITNLSQVRASNLTDLVYKQGQGGISKATVSIVFHNDDPKQSPAGYEHCETITVTRTIVIGGRNKYLINGHAVQAGAVADFFHSVQLNVNNPHFLIMQGRITKVLNMKPAEVLGMIEEAAGTRMYEAKKVAALKTIEKKQVKVEEIDKILAETINPKLESLRDERRAYLEWSKAQADAARLARLVTAWAYTSAQAALAAAIETHKAAGEAKAAAEAKAVELKALLAGKEKEIKAAEKRAAETQSGAYKAVLEEEESLGKKLASASAAAANKRKALKEEEASFAGLTRTRADAEASIASLKAALAAQRAAADEATAASTAAADAVTAALKRYSDAQAGLLSIAAEESGAGAGGAGAGAGSDTAEGALMKLKSRITALGSEAASAEVTIKHCARRAKELEKAAGAASADRAAMTAGLAKARDAHAAASAKVAALRFDAAGDEAARARRDALAAEVGGKEAERVDSDYAAVSSMVDLQYNPAGLGPDWDRSAVRGAIASLITVTRPDAASALEAGAAGRLFNIVTRDEKVGKALLDKGGLRKRVTLAPLNKVQNTNPIPERVIRAAADLSRGTCVPALSCVTFPEDVRPAVEFALGSFLVCPDSATAKAVCFHRDVNRVVVTFAGDVFDPSGTLEGGAAPTAPGGATLPLLLRLPAAREAMRALEAKRAELKELEARLKASEAASKAHAAAAAAADMAAHEVKLAEERLANSAAAASDKEVADNAAALAAAEKALAGAKAELASAKDREKALQAELADKAKARESRTREAEKALGEAKKAAATAATKAKAASTAAEATACDLTAAEEELADAEKALARGEASLATAKAEAAAAERAAADVEGKHAKAKAALEAAREQLAAANAAVRQLVKDRDEASRGVEEAENAAKKAAKDIAAAVKESNGAEARVRDLAAKHAWIEGEKAFFGKPHTDFDWERNDPEAARKSLADLEKRQEELGRRINKKVIGMIEGVERDAADLASKKRIIENDKAKIERVIGELDEKKNEALRSTWAKVNTDFGSIFSTLLPGVTAKLDPPEGGTVLDGLEVKVAFNGVWKDSLSDLSGGQRSLLALSLILSLLLFKPAPMYILDEVDAALDLSHTQNIGKMIRSHFAKSQFIVVSLKQGMFANANVVFRTKFVEGIGSTVTRTVPSGSALLMDATAAAGAGVGAGTGGAAAAARKRGGAMGGAGGPSGAAADDDDDGSGAGAGAGAGAARAGAKGKGAVAAGRGRKAAAGAFDDDEE